MQRILNICVSFFDMEMDEGETYIELEARYLREKILRSPAAYREDLFGLTDEEKLIELSSMFVKEEVYLDP